MFCKGCVFAICMFLSVQAASYGGKIGVDFSVSSQPDVGLKWHISNLYCINPYLGFSFSKARDNTFFLVGIANQFYLPSFAELDQYIDISPAFYLIGNSPNFEGNIGYGLQYQFNSTISIYGELGIGVIVPDGQFGTFRSGLGAILYFK
jgi:hypothetical protein